MTKNKLFLTMSLLCALPLIAQATPPTNSDIFDVNKFNTDSSYKTDFNNYAMEYTDTSGKKYYMLGKRSPITGLFEAIYYLDADKLEYDKTKVEFKFKDGYNQDNLMTDSVIITTLPSGITIQSTDKNGKNIISSITSKGEITTTGLVHAKGFTADNGKLTEISDGEISPTSMDAINGSQLYKILQELGGGSQVNYNALGANVASLAALHPLPYSEDSKLNFAVGFGKYKSESSLALGLFYTPNKDLRVSTGIALGKESQNVFNIGLSLRVGKSSTKENINTLKDLNEKIALLTTENNNLKAELESQGNKIENLEKIIHNLLQNPH